MSRSYRTGLEIKKHLTRLLIRLSNNSDQRLFQVFSDLTQALTNQHSCIDLSRYNDVEAIRSLLLNLDIVGTGQTATPLVLDDGRLFLSRFYQYEQRVATRLSQLNRSIEVDERAVAETIDRLFPEPSRQKLAAFQALSRKLTIIAGGPGTGKTTTVNHILAALQTLVPDNSNRIAIAAPTGKAAMRLQDSLGDDVEWPDVTTLHRLLGYHPADGSYRHGPEFPLAIDVLVIDEVSMVDLAMMDRVLAALPPAARLILLGDPVQLPSVDTGNLLADICSNGFHYSPDFATKVRQLTGIEVITDGIPHRLQDALCELTKNYRFSPHQGIGRLAAALREDQQVELVDDDQVRVGDIDALDESTLMAFFDDYLAAVRRGEPGDVLTDLFASKRVLSPVRDGELGVIRLNARIEQALTDKNLILPGQPFYHGRPVMISRNDYNLRLFNGDVGICTAVNGTDARVLFRQGNSYREFLASRLPAHETCFAMTVHKSQGSEFDHVMLVLPQPHSPAQTQLLTREMLYTGITRARKQLTVNLDAEALALCLSQHNQRNSGLGERFRITD